MGWSVFIPSRKYFDWIIFNDWFNELAKSERQNMETEKKSSITRNNVINMKKKFCSFKKKGKKNAG
jgi:hypothetical protein